MEISEEENVLLVACQKIASLAHESRRNFSITHEMFNRIPLKEVKKIISELQVIYYFLF